MILALLKTWLGSVVNLVGIPGFYIVACSDAVFLVDLRLKECSVTCLMKIQTLCMYAPDENERYLALPRAGPDNFYFTVASSSLLVLCGVRKPLMPVLQWVHGINGPCYMTVLGLSMLRSHSKDFALSWDHFGTVSSIYFAMDLNCHFEKDHSRSISTTFHAWEIPFEINLSSRECHCGSCLLREELSKDGLPKWVDWKLKKEIVLGFGILSNDLAALLCEPDGHGGFTLVRILSPGKVELQRYHASWAPAGNIEDCHEPVLCLESHLLYPMSDEKYKFSKRFFYLKLDYLYAYANGNLAHFLSKKL